MKKIKIIGKALLVTALVASSAQMFARHKFIVINKTNKPLWVNTYRPNIKPGKIVDLRFKIDTGKQRKVEARYPGLFKLAWSNSKPWSIHREAFAPGVYLSDNNDTWTLSFTIKPKGVYTKRRIYMKKPVLGIKLKAQKDVTKKAAGPFRGYDEWID